MSQLRLRTVVLGELLNLLTTFRVHHAGRIANRFAETSGNSRGRGGMGEQRQGERVLVLKSAHIRRDHEPAIDCAVLNVSESGACILVPRNTAIPSRFELVIDPDPACRACVVVWRDDARIGVEFTHSPKLEGHR